MFANKLYVLFAAVGIIPDKPWIPRPEDLLPITLICDNIRDPGNMGTVIRTAVAAGCSKILLTRGAHFTPIEISYMVISFLYISYFCFDVAVM